MGPGDVKPGEIRAKGSFILQALTSCLAPATVEVLGRTQSPQKTAFAETYRHLQ